MTKNLKQMWSVKFPYVAPFTESHHCEYQRPLATSLDGDAGEGDDDGEINGAKSVVLSFEDPWDDIKI